jgi:chitinase
MISSARRGQVLRGRIPSRPDGMEDESMMEELERLRAENRRLAVSLGGFSAFIASKGLLEDAWHYVHAIHQIEESGAA